MKRLPLVIVAMLLLFALAVGACSWWLANLAHTAQGMHFDLDGDTIEIGEGALTGGRLFVASVAVVIGTVVAIVLALVALLVVLVLCAAAALVALVLALIGIAGGLLFGLAPIWIVGLVLWLLLRKSPKPSATAGGTIPA